MPEIAEVYRIVHYLRRHVLNRKISNVLVQEDNIVYGKVGCTASQFQSAMVNKSVVDVKQQGKYFWLVMSSPPHALMHLGMTGWIKFSNDDTAYYRPKKDGEKEEWPPKFWKFRLVFDGKPDCEVAFVDPRRLGRIRLVDVPAEEMRKTTPLKENGPDPMVDKDIFTKEWLRKKLRNKKVPVKALLLDQGNISGIGNWVADEVLYQTRIHPEQYSNTFSDEEIDRLRDKIIEVCTISCDALADSSQFPDTWLMRHRWNKGKKHSNTLPSGEKIVHIKVGGRTSAVVPSVQKNTGAVAADIDSQTIIDDGTNGAAGADTTEDEKKPKKKPSAKKAVKEEEDDSKPQPKQKRKAQDLSDEVTPKKSKSHKAAPVPTRRSSRRST